MDTYAVRLLEELCATSSSSGDERAAVELMVREAAAAGMRSFADEAGNFIAERGTGPRTLVFLGHIDTVPGFITPRIEDGRLYGRGAVDAKGPLAAFFVAAVQVELPAGLRVVTIGAVEEEAPTSKGAHHVVDRYRPDFAIIGEPSGVAGITLGYKGRISLRYSARKPMAHTAAAGSSVAAEAVAAWSRLEAHCHRLNDGRGVFDRLDPHLARFNTSSNDFAELAEFRATFRLPLDFDLAGFTAAVEEMIPGSAEVAFDQFVPSFKADKRNALVRAMLQAMRSEGLQPTFKVKTGTSDMNIVGPAWGCPIVAYGPGDSRLDHTPNEHVPIAEYLQAIAVLEKAIGTLASSSTHLA